jgi:hypothetical protein
VIQEPSPIYQGRSPKDGPTYTIPVRDSRENAPGWLDLGMTFSCVPHAVYPWKPEILKMIWEFDPGIVPIWIDWTFQAPSDDATPSRTVTFGRHAVGRYKSVLSENVPKIESCDMPSMPCQGVTFKRPNILIRMFEGDPMPGYPSDLPGEFVPWDASIYKRLQQLFIRDDISTKQLAKQLVENTVEAREKRREACRKEHEERMADIEKYATKKLEAASDREIEEHFLRRQHRTRASKPFVDLGGTDARGQGIERMYRTPPTT